MLLTIPERKWTDITTSSPQVQVHAFQVFCMWLFVREGVLQPGCARPPNFSPSNWKGTPNLALNMLRLVGGSSLPITNLGFHPLLYILQLSITSYASDC